jgi:colanic acid biosynthesis glycosyl transferase WcaI
VRVLVVSQYFWPEEFRVNDLVAGLIERGHQVTVLTNPPNYPGGAIFPAWREDPKAFADFGGAAVVRVPVVARGSRSLTLMLNYLSFVASACAFGPWKLRGQRFDAVFCFQTTPVTVALPALLLGRIKRAPVTMWVLDLWPESLAAVGAVRSPFVLQVVGELVRFIYRRLDRILLASQAFRDSVLRHGADPSRVEAFPNWVEPEFIAPAGAKPAPETAPFRGTFNIVFAGNIGEAQDMPVVLEAAERTRDLDGIRWLIVGDGRRAEATRAEIARRALGDRVIMLGRHPTARMPEFFAAADALLVSLKDDPIFHVTVPGKVQSYLASGKPVLAMLTGEGARVIEESGGGLTSPAGDAGALAESVRKMSAMTAEERAAAAVSGQNYCRAYYSRSDLLDRLEGWLGRPARS